MSSYNNVPRRIFGRLRSHLDILAKVSARKTTGNFKASSWLSEKQPAGGTLGISKPSEETPGAIRIHSSFICIECGYSCGAFRLTVAGVNSGSFCYIAKCPRCSSCMVKPSPGFYESDLLISTRGDTTITGNRLLPTR